MTHTIHHRIEHARLSFRTSNAYDREPDSIYLGREEYEELKAYAATVCNYVNKRNGRNQYRGCNIFQVDADSHLAVS